MTKPGPGEGRAVIVCESIHDVLALERALHDAELWCDLIPTPRQLSSNCGMALRVRLADDAAIARLRQVGKLRLRGVYREVDGGYTPL